MFLFSQARIQSAKSLQTQKMPQDRRARHT